MLGRAVTHRLTVIVHPTEDETDKCVFFIMVTLESGSRSGLPPGLAHIKELKLWGLQLFSSQFYFLTGHNNFIQTLLLNIFRWDGFKTSGLALHTAIQDHRFHRNWDFNYQYKECWEYCWYCSWSCSCSGTISPHIAPSPNPVPAEIMRTQNYVEYPKLRNTKHNTIFTV